MSSKLLRAAPGFVGGRLCVDFANTVDWRTSDRPQELILDYGALLRWSEARGSLPGAAIDRLRRRYAREPEPAERVMEGARELREALWRMADALRTGGAFDLRPFNGFLAAVPAQPRLVASGAGFVHELPGRALEEPLWPVLWSLTALLSSVDAGRVGCCRAEGCGWFFVDESPNRSRLWCSAETCGNRERARRAYARRSSRVS